MLEWLAGLLRKTLVSRLVVSRTVTSDALVEFFVALRANTAGNNSSSKFVQFWPNLFPGLRLFETRYREGKGDAGWIGGGFDADGDGGSGSEVDDLGPAASKLREFLGESDWVRGHLDSIEQAFDLIDKEDGDTADLDLISVLVKNLPDHLYGDFDSAIDIVRDILNSVEAAVFAMATEETKSDQESLNEVLLRVASAFFKRDDWRALVTEDRPKVLGTHKGDEKITDDIDELKREFADLPQSEHSVAENNVVEVLNIVLHCLLSGVEHKTWKAAYAQLNRLIENLPTAGILLLESYVREALRVELEDLRRVRNDVESKSGLTLFTHFQHAGILELCRTIGVVTPELMLEFFPAGLGALVDSFDRRSQEDLEVLDEYLQTAGQDRLFMAEQALIDACGMLEESRLRSLLACRGRSSLPFAFFAIKRGGVRTRPWIVQYLRGLRLDTAESEGAVDRARRGDSTVLHSRLV